MVDWGTVPAWVGAVATSAGLLAAGLAARFAYRNARTAEQTAASREMEHRRSHAAKVVAWLDRTEDGHFVALAVNRSEVPIYKVVVGFRSPNHENDFHIPILPPAPNAMPLGRVTQFINEARSMYPNIDASWLFQGGNGTLKVPRPTVDGGKEWVEEFQLGPIGLTIAFTDAEGVRWERGVDGLLEEKTTDYKPFRGAVLPSDTAFPSPTETKGERDGE